MDRAFVDAIILEALERYPERLTEISPNVVRDIRESARYSPSRATRARRRRSRTRARLAQMVPVDGPRRGARHTSERDRSARKQGFATPPHLPRPHTCPRQTRTH